MGELLEEPGSGWEKNKSENAFTCTAITRLEASVKTSHFHISGRCCREACSKWILAENLAGEFKSDREMAVTLCVCLIPSCWGQNFRLSVHSKAIYIYYIIVYQKCFFLLNCAIASNMFSFFSSHLKSKCCTCQNLKKKMHSCSAFFLFVSLFSFKIHTHLNPSAVTLKWATKKNTKQK